MRFTHFFFLLYFFIFLNCKEEKKQLFKIEGKHIEISDSIPIEAEIEAYIKPFRDHIQKDLDSVLSYAAHTFSKKHPISKLNLIVDKDYEILRATIQEKNIEQHTTYYVATSDYLYNGGDNMHFFKPNDSVYYLNYKIRNALIDTFLETDSINPIIDDRFIQKK